MAGDNARRVNYWYRQASALPMERVPGFAFHQSEVRSLARDAATRGASSRANGSGAGCARFSYNRDFQQTVMTSQIRSVEAYKYGRPYLYGLRFFANRP